MADTDSMLPPPGQSNQIAQKETKVIYHVDDEETPYLMKIPKPPNEVTLADFKEQLNRPAAKFFFKSKDEEVGIVKEEVMDDATILPLYNGRIVSWIVTNDGSGSDVKSDKTGSGRIRKTPEYDDDDTTTLASGISGVPKPRKNKKRHVHGPRHKPRAIDSVSQYGDGDTATELESNVWDESDLTSMASYSTMTSISTVAKGKRRVFTKTLQPRMPRIYSSTTLAESTFSESLQIITVTLRMDHINFLGISIMGQSAEDGVGGIFVGSIMNGGAVAADGRIQAGDLILNVNDVEFSNLTNEEAVKVLRDVVQANGPITITVARPTYDGMEEMPNFEPRNEPIQPMDPAMWLHQTQSHSKPLHFNQHHPTGRSPTSTTLTSDSGSQATSNSMPEADRDLVTKLTLATSINLVARAMAATNSGLERKDHKWLKMKIPNSFLGSNAVDWLFNNVEGFIDRRHAKKYCSLMLKDGYIKHTVNKASFSEQCYYVFGDIFSASKPVYKTPSELEKALGKMNIHTASSDSGDADTIAVGELPSVVPWSSEERLPPAYSEVRSSGSESGHRAKTKRTGTPDSNGSGSRKPGRAIGGPLTRDQRMGSIMSSASTDFTSVSQQRPGSNRRMPDVDQMSIISGRSLAQMRAQVLSNHKKDEDQSAIF